MTTTIKLYGASDDLVYAEGHPAGVDGCDEYSHSNDEAGFLACSDGTIIQFYFDETGRWRVTVEKAGTATFTLVREGDGDADEHSDVAELVGDITWVKWCGTDDFLARALRLLPDGAAEHATELIDRIRDADSNAGFDRWWDDLSGEDKTGFTVSVAEILNQLAAERAR